MIMKTVFRAILALILIGAFIAVPARTVAFLKKDIISDELYSRREKYFYGVINIWQLDSFEGGTGSRAYWLKDIVKGFEKQNNGVYINVETLSIETANKLLSSGQKRPDMISFGMGINIDEAELEQISAQDAILRSDIEKMVYSTAIPWCMGAYFLYRTSQQEDVGSDGEIVSGKRSSKCVYSVGIPQKSGYHAAYALLNSINEEQRKNFSNELSVFSAEPRELFESFNYSLKVKNFVGTQRDLYRLDAASSRQSNRACEIDLLDKYNDLIQYISVLKCNNSKKLYTMQAFINYLLSQQVQARIGEIGLFPVTDQTECSYCNSFASLAWEKVKNARFDFSSSLFNNNGENENEEQILRNGKAKYINN